MPLKEDRSWPGFLFLNGDKERKKERMRERERDLFIARLRKLIRLVSARSFGRRLKLGRQTKPNQTGDGNLLVEYNVCLCKSCKK